MHDAGTLLNPMIAEGQMRGAFAQGMQRRYMRNTSATRAARFFQVLSRIIWYRQ
jgi:xanthine dehydrogenase molybdopterin-binding subunit B